MPTIVDVYAGSCGFRTVIKAESETYSTDDVCAYAARISIESECPYIKDLAKKVKRLTIHDLYKPVGDNPVYKEAAVCLRHPMCPVPCAILKAAEAEMGLALKRNVSITFREE